MKDLIHEIRMRELIEGDVEYTEELFITKFYLECTKYHMCPNLGVEDH